MHDIESKVCVLGHIQRGGSPTGNDRFYGSLMGRMAVDALSDGKIQHAIVVRNSQVACVPLDDCANKSDHVMRHFAGLAEELSI